MAKTSHDAQGGKTSTVGEGVHEGIEGWFRKTTYHGENYGYSSQDDNWSHPSHGR